MGKLSLTFNVQRQYIPKANLFKKKPRLNGGFNYCGVGGDRTLVQTRNPLAFYMFSFI